MIRRHIVAALAFVCFAAAAHAQDEPWPADLREWPYSAVIDVDGGRMEVRHDRVACWTALVAATIHNQEARRGIHAHQPDAIEDRNELEELLDWPFLPGRRRYAATPILRRLTASLECDEPAMAGGPAMVLGHFGPDALPALPWLRALVLEEHGNAAQTRWALFLPLLYSTPREMRVGPVALRFLKSMPAAFFEPTNDEGTEEGASEVFLVLQFTERTKVEVPSLIQAASAEYPFRMRLLALLSITPSDEPVGPLVLRFLESLPDDVLQRYSRVESRTDGSPHPLGVSPARAAWIDCTSVVAASMISSSGRENVETPAILEAASPKYPRAFRAVAIGTLAELEEEARAAVPGLRALLKDDDALIRAAAAIALVKIEADPAGVPEIIRAAALQGDDERSLRAQADAIVGRRQRERDCWRKHGGDLAPYLIRRIEQSNGPRKRESMRLLSLLGPAGREGLPALRSALDDPDEDTRRSAARALRDIDAERSSKPAP